MYIKKKDRELFTEIDNYLELPEKWKEFINNISIKNRFIIKLKEKNLYQCGNCNSTFEEQIKINDYCQCPHCKFTYKVRSNKLKSYSFKNKLAILEKYKDYYIVRVFELETLLKNNKYENLVFEYGRIILDNKFNLLHEIINDNVVGTTGGMYVVCRYLKSSNWRYINSYYFSLPNYLNYYPYNLKELLQAHDNLKYSELWELTKHIDCNLLYLIKNYNPNIEILTKMKLYSLALCPKTFNTKNAEEYKKLIREYLPFMQKYDLNLDELIVLSYLKVQDINYIRKFEYLSQENLESLSKKVNLKTLIERTDFDSSKFHEYRDYLDIAKKLKLNMKDKKILYPKKIVSEHNKLLKEYEQKKDRILNKNLLKRYKQLEKNIFKDNKFIIFPAKNLDSLIDESSQQDNCVRTYAERIAEGKCDIYFMRLLEDQEHSLVTVEVVNSKVVQKRTKHNQATTKIQDNFLQLWERKILGGTNEKKFN